MSDLANQFLDLFAEAEQLVAQAADRGPESHHGFLSNLEKAVERERKLRGHRAMLRICSSLRNTLVHERFGAEHIAQPNPQLVEALKRVIDALRDPPRIVQHFARELREFSPDDQIGMVLEYTARNEYSQVVVRVHESLELLSSHTIHRWLAHHAEQTLVELDVTVADVLRYREPNSVEIHFTPRTTTLYEAVDIFHKGQSRKILALVVTERGKATEKPLAFLTPWDMADVAHIIGDVE